MRAARRLAYWFRFRSEQADLRDELAFHRDQVARDLEQRGLSPNAARAFSRVAAMSASVWASDMKPASNWDGAK